MFPDCQDIYKEKQNHGDPEAAICTPQPHLLSSFLCSFAPFAHFQLVFFLEYIFFHFKLAHTDAQIAWLAPVTEL